MKTSSENNSFLIALLGVIKKEMGLDVSIDKNLL
jgi:hypothetical protein